MDIVHLEVCKKVVGYLNPKRIVVLGEEALIYLPKEFCMIFSYMILK